MARRLKSSRLKRGYEPTSDFKTNPVLALVARKWI